MVDYSRRPAFCTYVALSVSLLAAMPVGAAGIARLGTPQMLNVASPDFEGNPAAACAESGPFAATWSYRDGDGWGVAARTFAWGGAPVSAELPVNTATVSHQDSSAIARDAAGNFVVLWRDWSAEGAANGMGVRGRLYSAAGVGAPEFAVNSYAPDDQEAPAVARSATGSFVATWDGFGPGAIFGVWLRRFDAAGSPQGVETLVAVAGQYPSIAMNPATGGFVIAWHRHDGTSHQVFAQRYDATGEPLGGVLNVNTSTAGSQYFSVVAFGPGGVFVVLFEGEGQDDAYGILGQLFDPSGTPIGDEFWANNATVNDQFGADVAFDETGGFLVTWTSRLDAVHSRLWAAEFSPLAIRLGVSDFPLTESLADGASQISSSLCRDGARSFRVLFREYNATMTNSEVVSQRLLLGIFADGFDNGDMTAWAP